MNEDIKFITDFLKCDYEILEGGLEDDSKIMNWYKENLEKGKKEGYTPLIIIPTDTLSEQLDFFWKIMTTKLKIQKNSFQNI